MTMTVDFFNLERKVADAVNVASARGYEVPAEFLTSARITREAQLVANSPQPLLPAPPSKPSAVAAWVAAAAYDRLEWREAKAVAIELSDAVKRAGMRAVLERVPGYLARVIEDFGTAFDDFSRLLKAAPHETSSAMSGKQFEAHAELLRAAETLTGLAYDRARLAQLADEGDEIGNQALWLVLDPSPSATLETVTAVVVEFRDAFPASIADWDRLSQLGVSMAHAGDVVRRKERHAALVFAGGMEADGGMRDKTYREASALPASVHR